MGWRDWFPRLPRLVFEDDAANAFVAAYAARLSTIGGSPLGVGPLEACAGLWSRGMVSATVTGGPASKAITPTVLSHIGRQLVRQGEAIFAIEVRDGAPSLIPAVSAEIQGGSPWPQDWVYELDLATPVGTVTRTYAESSVLHFRYGTHPSTPWRGESPLDFADRTGAIIANLERTLGDDATTPTATLIAVPEGQVGEDDPNAPDPIQELMTRIGKARGNVLAVETTAGGWGDRGSAPQSDYGTKRIGPAVTAPMVSELSTVITVVSAACGVPPALVAGLNDGTAQRESWRRFLFATIQPEGLKLLEEIHRKLDPTAEISWAELAAADVAARARAWRGMVGPEARMPDATARRIAGLDPGGPSADAPREEPDADGSQTEGG